MATGERSGTRRKISWDVVRTGCVLMVMIYHATYLGTVLHPELRPRTFAFPYQAGASLLLVISAYFACVTIGRGPLLRYWWGRLARLLPPFFAAVVLIFLISQAFPVEQWYLPTLGDVGTNLLMLWNWKPQLFAFVDGSHWTVPLQLMGFTAAAVLYRGRWGHGRRIVVVLWAALITPLLQWPYRMSGPPELYRTIVDGFGLHRWHLFVAGAAIWLWSTKRIGTGHFAALISVCMAAHALHNYVATPRGWVTNLDSTVAVWIGMCVVAVAAAGPDWDRHIPGFAQGPIQWFAGVSYGVFLMHQSVGYLVSRHLQDLGAPATVQTLAMLITGTLLGWFLTRVVEQPAYRFLMNIFDRKAAQPTAGNSSLQALPPFSASGTGSQSTSPGPR